MERRKLGTFLQQQSLIQLRLVPFKPQLLDAVLLVHAIVLIVVLIEAFVFNDSVVLGSDILDTFLLNAILLETEL